MCIKFGINFPVGIEGAKSCIPCKIAKVNLSVDKCKALLVSYSKNPIIWTTSGKYL